MDTRIFLRVLALTLTMWLPSGRLYCQPLQKSSQNKYSNLFIYDKLLSRFTLEPNFSFGAFNRKIEMNDLKTAYSHSTSINNYYNYVYLNKGDYYSYDVKLFYYLKKHRNIGFGTGLMNIHYTTGITLTNFQVQYQSLDFYGNPFTQIITASSPVIEKINDSHFIMPLVCRLKWEDFRKIKLFVEAGLIVGDYVFFASEVSAKLDYEAIYQRQNSSWSNDVTNSGNTQYLELTRSYLTAHNPAIKDTIDDYFRHLHTGPNKYNIGLDNQIHSKSIESNFYFPAGFTAKTGFTYNYNQKICFNLGIAWSTEWTSTNQNRKYELTNNVGEYHSLVNGYKYNNTNYFGASIGVNIHIGDHDWDNDGVIDIHDRCNSDTAGILQFCGCVDSDHDGIPDYLDNCPDSAGPACTIGCPDRDGDCVPDRFDRCPDEPGLESLSGCRLTLTEKDTIIHSNRISIDFLIPVRFSPGSAELNDSSKMKLRKIIAEPNIEESNIMIVEYGTNFKLEYQNDSISHERATAIMNFLTDEHLARNRIVFGVTADVSLFKNAKLILYGEDIFSRSEYGRDHDQNREFSVPSTTSRTPQKKEELSNSSLRNSDGDNPTKPIVNQNNKGSSHNLGENTKIDSLAKLRG